MTNIYQQLSEHFPKEMERTLNKGGANLTYIPVSEVHNRMNKIIGLENWSLKIQNYVEIGDSIVAHVTVTAIIDGKEVQRDGVGGQKIKRIKATGVALDYGDEVKGAVSDAFKKAAQTLGVGLYLARSEDAMEIEDVMDSAQPASPPDPELIDKWDKFVSIVKTLDDDKKSSLNEFWTTKANGQPKPTKSTATHESLNLLTEEAIRLSFSGEYVVANNE